MMLGSSPNMVSKNITLNIATLAITWRTLREIICKKSSRKDAKKPLSSQRICIKIDIGKI